MFDPSQFTRRCSRVRKVLCSVMRSQGNDSYIYIFTSLIASGLTILHTRPTFLENFPIFLASVKMHVSYTIYQSHHAVYYSQVPRIGN